MPVKSFGVENETVIMSVDHKKKEEFKKRTELPQEPAYDFGLRMNATFNNMDPDVLCGFLLKERDTIVIHTRYSLIRIALLCAS